VSIFGELKRRNVLRVGAAYIVSAWLIVQVAETLFPLYGLSDAALRLVVNILAIGLVPALALAWVFEWTPEGLKKEKDADHAGPVSRRAARRLDQVILVVLALGVAYFAVDKFVLDPARDAKRELEAETRGRTQALIGSYGTKSIAVMPFVNMSPDPDQEYFSDGISEELLNLLAQIQDLRVISRSSVFALKGTDLSIPEIGERLNVAHVLEGSVRKSGNTIRITAQLIEAGSDTHLWSQNYDRELEDVFAIQDEIALLVVDELKAELLGDMPKALKTDPAVLTLTLQARRAGSDQERRIVLLEEALRIDPGYVPAMRALNLAYYWKATDGDGPFNPADFERTLKVMTELSERANAIAPNNGQVLAWRGWNAFEFERDFQKAANLMERAFAAAPGDEMVMSYVATFARRIGHFETAIRIKKLLAERGPECHICINIWQDYLAAQRYDEAIEARRVFTGENVSYYGLILPALLKGDAELALKYIMPGFDSPNYIHAFRAMALHSLGRAEEAKAEFDMQVAEFADTDPATTAMAAVWLGDEEGGLDLLYQRFWPHMHNFYQYVLNPVWEPLYDHPRWLALREKSGRTTEAYTAVKFKPLLPE